MPFTGDTFTHLFDWEKDPQRQDKIVDARLEAEFDGIGTGLSSAAARLTAVEGQVGAGPADNSVTNAKLADMAAYTLKGRNAGTAGDPSDMNMSALIEKTTLAGDDLYLIQDSAASNAFKKVKAKTIANTAHDVVVLTTGTSWTVPTGCYVIHRLELWGGGGGGGRCTGAVPGSGGGGAGCAVSGGMAVTPGASITIAIGGGGAGSTGANAGTGGTTSFDTISATGGTGGGDDGAGGGLGGSGSGGDLNLAGDTGSQNPIDQQSRGGSSPRGGLGGVTGISSGAPAGGNTPGGGGGGGSTNGASQNGAAGAPGRILIIY